MKSVEASRCIKMKYGAATKIISSRPEKKEKYQITINEIASNIHINKSVFCEQNNISMLI